MKRFLTAVALAAAVLFTATAAAGCGKEEFDASRYVGAMLDAVYKGEYGDYVKMNLGTGEKAEKLHDDNIQGLVESLTETVGFDISDEARNQLTDTMNELCAKVDYTVGEGEENGGTYAVPVSVRALDFSGEFDSDEFNEEAEKAVKEAMKDNADITSEELNTILMDLFIEKIQKINEDPTYAEKETVTIELQKNDDDLYEIPYETLQKLDEKLIR